MPLHHLQSLSQCCKVPFYKYFYAKFSDELSSLLPRINEFKYNTILGAGSQHLIEEMASCNGKLEANSFFCRAFCLWKSHPACFFPVNFDLRKF